MTKEDGIRKVKEFSTLITSLSALTALLIMAGYKLYGNEMVKDTLKEELRPIIIRITLVEQENHILKKNLSKLGVKQDFTNDVLYNMNPQAYLKTKKERQDKEN